MSTSVNQHAERRYRLTRHLWSAPARRVCRERSVILGYHGVGSTRLRDDPSLLQVRPERFRRQLEALLEGGARFLTVAELVKRATGGEPPPGYAAVSFDDGMRNNLTTALPIMREHGIPGTVYVTIDFIDARSPWVKDAADNHMLSVAELRELVAAGWEIGAHTLTHPDLSRLSYEDCVHEIEGSKLRLEELLEIPIETFAYPFGARSPTAVRAAQASGLKAAVSTGLGSWDPFETKRVMIGALDPMPVVLLKLDDRYEPLLRSRPMTLLRQASKRVRSSRTSERTYA